MARSTPSAALDVTGKTLELTRCMILRPTAGRRSLPCRRRGTTWLLRRWADGYTPSEVESTVAMRTIWLPTKSMILVQTIGKRANPYLHHAVVSPQRSLMEKFSFSVARPPPEHLIKLRPTIRRPTVGALMPQCRPPGMAWERLRWGSASMSSRGAPRLAVPPRPATRSSPHSSAPRRRRQVLWVAVVTLAWADATGTFPVGLSRPPTEFTRWDAPRCVPRRMH